MNKTKNAKRPWSAAEEQQLRELYPETPLHQLRAIFNRSARAICAKAFGLSLKRSEDFMAGPCAGRIKPGANIGGAVRFDKGHAPWNKGLKGYKAGGRAAETQFKPGHLSGAAAAKLQPIGAERITKDGTLQRKVSDQGTANQRWRSVHSLLWEEHNGPVPVGHIVVFKNPADRRIEIDNLELVTRAENCRRNSIHRYSPELKEVIRLQKKLRRTIKERTDEKQTDRPA